MRWEDEKYVRLYTRDTMTWLMLSWQGRCVAALLLRKVDRAGLLDMGEHGEAGLAAMLGVPVDVAKDGLASLVTNKVVTRRGSYIVWPKFIEGQETPQSDKSRQRTARERARDIASAQEVIGTPFEENVTNRDESSHLVTNSHAASREVTLCCAVLSQTKKEYIPVSSESEPPAQQPMLAIVEPPPESAEDLVWRHWLTAWRLRIDGKRTPEFTDKRRAMARSRLESYSPEDLTRAIDALWASDWHVENGQYAFDLVMRNSEQVEKFLARCDAASVTRLRTVLPAYPAGSVPKTRPGATSAEQSVSVSQSDTPVSEDAMWEAIALLEDTRIVRSQ